MKLGCCCSLEDIEKFARVGFEFVECTVSTLKPEADDATFAPVQAAFRAAPLPVLAFNVFIPGDIKVTGPAVDEKRLFNYALRTIERMYAVGARILVFGSGGARNVPDGFPLETGREQFASFARSVGEMAQHAGVLVGIEAINRSEKTNIINSLTEAVDIARRVNHPSVKIIADVYHMALENEPFSHISEYKDWIVHVHLADAPQRGAPGTEQLPWAEAFHQLHLAGYDGLMSYECKWKDVAGEAPRSIRFVRKAWRESTM
jgi:sugar phosphate isomerase/epimerase